MPSDDLATLVDLIARMRSARNVAEQAIATIEVAHGDARALCSKLAGELLGYGVDLGDMHDGLIEMRKRLDAISARES